MGTIENYIENMFANLPKTNQIIKLKNNLLVNMEDKYNELKANGKSENEAIGIVISEFGNIDELLNEFGIEYGNDDEGEELKCLTEDEVNDYLKTSQRSGKTIGVGVFLCILAPAILILIDKLSEDGFLGRISKETSSTLSLIPLCILIATAVSMFIYNGARVKKFNYLESGFDLPAHVRTSIKQKDDRFNLTYTFSVIIGVVLCILSPVILFITSTISDDISTYGVVALLIIIATAVYIFIYYGTIKDSLKKLLKLEEYTKSIKEKNEENKIVRAAARIMWPLAVCIFLISGLMFHQWEYNWIIFPVTGLIFAMFSGVYGILKEKR